MQDAANHSTASDGMGTDSRFQPDQVVLVAQTCGKIGKLDSIHIWRPYYLVDWHDDDSAETTPVETPGTSFYFLHHLFVATN